MRGPLVLLLLVLLSTTPQGLRSAASADAPEPSAAPATDESLEEFVPSEEISADNAVSFPVDI
ncbi:MAG TPA: hypothetical protein VD788_12655 [Candidatus Polarisedimenticolaceae bacterium]|nr:hypothetical protein [Candidatus Polarisedimenticolaceae bacterium]